MKQRKTTKRALLMSALAVLLCVSMLVGSTFAWFTDSVTSAGNKIQAGTLKIDLEVYDKETDTWNSIKGSQEALFNYTNWEPGYTAVQLLKIENEGSLTLKWYAKFISQVELSKLADVIDVYVCPSATELTYPSRELAGYTKVGTVAEFVNTIQTTTNGVLAPEGFAYLGIALKMQEEAGNDYQGLDLGGAFDIQILATQMTAEVDSFNDQYDADAEFPKTALIVLDQNRTEAATVEAGPVAVEIPADAPAGNYKLDVEKGEVVTDENGNTVVNYEIDLTRDGVSVAADGVTFTVTVQVPVGINPDTVQVLHDGVQVANPVVDAINGTVTFTANSFSPYAIIYKVDATMIHDQDTNTYYVFNADGMMEVHSKFAAYQAGNAAKIVLCADIDMTDKVWTTVDSHVDFGKSYLASIDGQGHTISNLTVNGQAMFRRFAGSGNVEIKDVTFDKATVNSNSLNTSILTVQAYQNVLLDNVDVKNSSITGTYKVAPLMGTVYNENASTITATLKNCDVSDTVVTSTVYDFFTCGMVSFVYTTDNDYINYENCSITNVQLRSVGGGYNYHANIHYTSAETDDQINEHPGVTVTNVTFESIG